MLVALLQNNNNAQPQPQPRLPTINIDRGGGGPSWPRYDIVDIITAAATFPEVAGEDSVRRAARRQKWIGDALPRIKDMREKQNAAAFMMGAQLADAAAAERYSLQDQLKIEQLVAIIDDVRRESQPRPQALAVQPRAQQAGPGIGLFVGGLLVGGILVGLALRKRR